MEKLKNHTRGKKVNHYNVVGQKTALVSPWSYQLLCSYQITGLTLMHLSTFVETS